MERKFIYEISSFSPPKEPGSGRYGFIVYIDSKIARKAREIKMNDEAREHLEKTGKSIIERTWNQTNFGMFELCGDVYNFVDDSMLLAYCSVPGERCSLGIGTLAREIKQERVEYATHNCDNALQAYALLSLWLKWANGVNVFLNKS